MRLPTTLVTVVISASCASRQAPPSYVRATPVAEPPKPPAIVEVPRPLPLTGQLKRAPSTKGRFKTAADKNLPPWELVDDANKKAVRGPDPEGFFDAIMVYDFAPGALYQVYAAPLHLTAVQLQPGEKILGKPAVGDSIRWVLGVGRSGSSGTEPLEQQYLYVKPTRANLNTTLVINTDRRTYYLELHSFEDTYMAAVQFRYPHDELAELQAAANRDEAVSKTTTATNINLASINFSYKVTVEKGSPSWAPTQVFDDGRKTFIRFPPSMLVREAPALFVLSSANQTQLVNYRVKNDFYVVDRLVDRAELRVGQKDQEIVRIVRTR